MFQTAIDPILYVRTVSVDDPSVTPNTVAEFASAPNQALALENWRTRHAARPFAFEEAYRFWVGLRWPYLYRYATRGYQLARPDQESVNGVNGHGPHAESPPGLGAISVQSLVDAAATLTNFRVHSASSTWMDRLAFRRWCAETAIAASVLDVVSSELRDGQLAMRALVPLIGAAFHTTNPVATFGKLVEALAHVATTDHFLDWRQHPEPCRWSELFERLRRELPTAPDDQGSQDTARFLTMDSVLHEDGDHPVLSAAAREWQARAADEAAYGWFIEQASWAPRHIAEAVWRDFQPPVSIYVFRLASGSDHVFVTIDQRAQRFGDIWLNEASIREILARRRLIIGLGSAHDVKVAVF